MTTSTSFISIQDFAKYPFTVEAGQRIREANLTLSDLASPASRRYLERAIERIKQAVSGGEIPVKETIEDDDILAYPTALMLVSLICGESTRRRYALMEGKRAYQLMRLEYPQKLLQIATRTFKWDAQVKDIDVGKTHFVLALHFKDYIRNAARIHDLKWELINRVLSKGYVLLPAEDFARLLEEEVQARVFEKTASQPGVELPEEVEAQIKRLRPIIEGWEKRFSFDEIPKEMVTAAMPPCMKNLMSILQTGKHMPHMGNFALAAFLLNAGLSEAEALKLFMALTDFDENIARYQIEHIAGKHGSKTKYTAPNCATMKTHGLCFHPDEICETIHHPLAYYRKKARAIRRSGGRAEDATFRFPKA